MSADQNYPGDESPDGEKPVPNSAADDFFVKMNRQFRRPKPSEEAVAAALQAIQTLAGGVVSTETNAQGEESVTVEGAQCPKCGGMNAESNRFCGYCGTLVERTQTSTAKPMASSATGPSPNPAGQHIYHHHYHHHYFPGTGPRPTQNAQIAVSESVSPAISATDTVGGELGLRQLVEDWISHANSKAFDQLAALYSADAILVRSDATLLSGRSSIRQYLEASSSSEVQLELTDTRLGGGVACLAGVNRILPGRLARGAQERGGKFLMVARQESGRWRILADIWCMNRDRLPAPDDSLRQVSEPESAPAPTQMGRNRRSW
jgi:uncharacterized protein (TIGR02246 family)